MYLRGRLVVRGLADACATLDVPTFLLRSEDLRRRVRLERREAANAMRSNPNATAGPTTAGSHSVGNVGSDGPGAPGSDGPGVVAPKSGAHGTIGAPPAPCAPFDAETAAHWPASQLSTTFKAPKSRSMSSAHGPVLVGGLIGKPHAVLNSSSTRPAGLNSVAIA